MAKSWAHDMSTEGGFANISELADEDRNALSERILVEADKINIGDGLGIYTGSVSIIVDKN